MILKVQSRFGAQAIYIMYVSANVQATSIVIVGCIRPGWFGWAKWLCVWKSAAVERSTLMM